MELRATSIRVSTKGNGVLTTYTREATLTDAEQRAANMKLAQGLVQCIKSTALPKADLRSISRFVKAVSGGAVTINDVSDARKKNINFLQEFLAANPSDDAVDGV